VCCAQVIVSLLVSAVMLGVKATLPNATIRWTNRKQELEILVEELTRVRSSVPAALIERARRASEHVGPAEVDVRAVVRRLPRS
jgi:hypothetical protein